jgi:hypothetical protein
MTLTGNRKPISCPQCSAACTEVGHVLSYPKLTGSPWPSGKDASEHRYACPQCGREWIYQTKWQDIYAVPEDARFRIRVIDGQEIIQTQDPEVLAYWGLPLHRRAELTPEEVLHLDRKAARRRYEKKLASGPNSPTDQSLFPE